MNSESKLEAGTNTPAEAANESSSNETIAAEPIAEAASAEVSGTDKSSQTVEENRRYSSEEVADIIRLSLQDEARRADDSVDYQELLAIAAEMGVNKEQVAKAVRLLEEEQATHDKESVLWTRFRSHSILFVAVNLLCITINVLGSSTTFWSMYVLFGWGLFLLGHYAGLRYAPQFVEMATERTRQLASNQFQAMFDDDANIAFTETESTGMTETQGMISAEDDKLVVEFQTMDSLLGVFKSSIKVVEIPFRDLVSIRLEQRLWSNELVLQGRNMRVMKDLPGNSGGKVKLHIDRQSVRATTALVKRIRSELES